ncbi:MAG: hypothetical protein WCX85_03605, partial [Bacilli bacterium]
LLKQRRIDLLASGKAFAEILEYDNEISIDLSQEFSSINGIGNALFERIIPYLAKVKVSYIQRILKIRMRKIGDWMNDLEDLLIIINELYNVSVKKH